ncbi:serine/threonine-protein kinase [Amycolatopsis albispora]|uniref:non-specific serine/threonine protein kinase n=1 Tax=Amycolatopsis albispora TaxID=1804986 RepID=A0A344L801_9PSEU|nr:serine/threonine-protein kinase [Amycolatopsis albispora]AXB44175.1 hypothetical protein A4R43_17950 [Amycolatopsis albispora]
MSSADHTLPRFDLPVFAEEPVSPALVGGRYRLLSKTGAGSSAVVYRALDLRTERDVAVKLFHAGVAGQDFLRREREFRVLAELRHPGLVEFRESGFDLDRAYLVMQLVEGPTLAGRILYGRLTAAETARLGAAVADALAYVHSRGITHRDLKPANILLAGDCPLLTDFGLAHRLGSTDLTASGAVVGTAAYMAPEQVRGGEVGPPADVYALGLILLECLTGYREYPGTMVESALARLTRSPEIPDTVPPALRDLLSRMTDKHPTARPTATQLALELETVAQTVLQPEPAPPLPAALPRAPLNTPLAAHQPAPPVDEPRHPPICEPWQPPVSDSPEPPVSDSQEQPPASEPQELPVGEPRKRRRKLLLSAALPAVAAVAAGAFALVNIDSPGIPATQAPQHPPTPPTATAPVVPAATATLSPATGGEPRGQSQPGSGDTTQPQPTGNRDENSNQNTPANNPENITDNNGKPKNQPPKKPRNNN